MKRLIEIKNAKDFVTTIKNNVKMQNIIENLRKTI